MHYNIEFAHPSVTLILLLPIFKNSKRQAVFSRTSYSPRKKNPDLVHTTMSALLNTLKEILTSLLFTD